MLSAFGALRQQDGFLIRQQISVPLILQLEFADSGARIEFSESHSPELLAILALKHVALQLDFSLLRFVFGTGFGDWSAIPMVTKVVPPNFASFSYCQRTSPPFRRLQSRR